MQSATGAAPTVRTIGTKREDKRSLRVLALFAGIGGIEVGLEAAGHEVIEAYEIEPAAQAVLKARFPGLKIRGDIRELSEIDSSIDLVTAGFPCVDLSQAGQMRGLDGPASGLVRHVLDVISKSKVRYLCLENVPFMLRLNSGQAMSEIVEKLEKSGFHWAYRVVDARSFGIPHRRPRVLLVASRDSDPRCILLANWTAVPVEEATPVVGKHAIGFYSTEGNTGAGLVANAVPPLKPGSKLGIRSFPAILMPNGLAGTPTIADAERLQGLTPGWTVAADGQGRNVRWRLVGNAVNAKVSAWLGHQLATPSTLSSLPKTKEVTEKWPTCAWNVGDGRVGVVLAAHFDFERVMGLGDFLSENLEPLSLRACDGFIKRAERSNLRFPFGFLDALKAYSGSCISGK